jgi:cation diffusion facilitator family transporter
MNQQNVAIIGVGVNLLLTVGKIIFGILLNSAAITAEAIHSGLDIFSSLITFLGIRTAQKPIDEEHPYGHYRLESIAGLVVVILLIVSAGWILYEGIVRLIYPEPLAISVWALIFMAGAAVINEIMARLKFYVGQKFSSIGLMADGQHSRADVIASAGVFVGLILIKIWTNADAMVAILVGLYILWECWKLGKEVIDSLLDARDEKAEEKIKEILTDFNINLSDLKTRKIGSATFAEIELKVNPQMTADEITLLREKIENRLLSEIQDLKQVAISFESAAGKITDVKTMPFVKEIPARYSGMGRMAGFAAGRAIGWGRGRGMDGGFGRGLGPGRGLGRGLGRRRWQ